MRLEGTQRSISMVRDLPSVALYAFSDDERPRVILYLRQQPSEAIAATITVRSCLPY